MMDPLFHRYFKNPEGGLIISLLLRCMRSITIVESIIIAPVNSADFYSRITRIYTRNKNIFCNNSTRANYCSITNGYR